MLHRAEEVHAQQPSARRQAYIAGSAMTMARGRTYASTMDDAGRVWTLSDHSGGGSKARKAGGLELKWTRPRC